MQTVKKVAMVLGVLALAACTSADRFEGTGGAGSGAGGFDADLGDPSSPVYFSRAVGDRVFFGVDESTLSPAAQVTLDAQAAWLISNPDYDATIEGHADERGTREYNIGLSNRRAVAVREYLISRGIAGTRLVTVGFGKERPVEICSEESCYSQNRRSVTILTGGALG